MSACISRNRDTLSQTAASWSPTSRTMSVSPADSPSRNTSNSSTSLAIGLHPQLVEELGAEGLRFVELMIGELLRHPVEERPQQRRKQVAQLAAARMQASLEEPNPGRGLYIRRDCVFGGQRED